MIQKLSYYITENTVPYQNLALEEYLLTHVEPGQCILYLWQNRHTVVIGRNQNAWTECRVQELEEDGGYLVRRLSGGGAVYHDLGNLNFTFLVRQADYDVDRQLSVLQKAVQTFGLDAQKTGRNDVTIEGRKFSGNAFYKTGDCCYHHGTILVHVDMTQMSRFLQVSKAKLESKGVESVRSRVVNLQSLNPDITVSSLIPRLLESFGRVYGLEPEKMEDAYLPWEQIRQREEFFSSWAWRCGAKTSFRESVQARFSWGSAELAYRVQGGCLTDLRLFSDGLEADFLAALPERLNGCPYDRDALDRRSREIRTEGDLQKTVLEDCMALLKSQIE